MIKKYKSKKSFKFTLNNKSNSNNKSRRTKKYNKNNKSRSKNKNNKNIRTNRTNRTNKNKIMYGGDIDVFKIVYELISFNMKLYVKETDKRFIITKYFRENPKNTIISMLEDYNPIMLIIFNKDTSSNFNRLKALIEIIRFIDVDLSFEKQISYIFFAMEYIIGLQIFSDGNHRTSAYLVEILLNKLKPGIGKKFISWYNSNFSDLNKESGFGFILVNNGDYNLSYKEKLDIHYREAYENLTLLTRKFIEWGN